VNTTFEYSMQKLWRVKVCFGRGSEIVFFFHIGTYWFWRCKQSDDWLMTFSSHLGCPPYYSCRFRGISGTLNPCTWEFLGGGDGYLEVWASDTEMGSNIYSEIFRQPSSKRAAKRFNNEQILAPPVAGSGYYSFL